MKTSRKSIVHICLILALFLALSAVTYVGFLASAESSNGEMFDYSSSAVPLKYKAAQSDVNNPTQKGLLMYGYDSGAFAQFKSELNGTFMADLMAVRHGNSTDLSGYSLVFTDTVSKKSFSVIVENKGSYNNICVSVDGNKAGIYYYNGTAYGYTALYNSGEMFTSVTSDEIQLQFDPSSMQVNVLGDDGTYHLVWDFSEQYNDGKLLQHDLPQFGNYTVKIVFDEVKSNGKGELLVYSFGGHSFEKASADGSVSLFANVMANAVVGQEYSLPQAYVTDLFYGELPADDVSVDVYDINGNVLNNGEYKFVPTTEGEYFIYYSYGKNADNEPTAVAFYKIEALDQADFSYKFRYDNDDIDSLDEIGVCKSVYIPKGAVESKMLLAGSASATVTIKKNGAVVDGYENIAGGFTYTFMEAGTYSVIYQVKVNDEMIADEKTITISANVPTYVVEEVSSKVEVGTTLNLTAGKVYVNNFAYAMDISMRYPSGKIVKEGKHTLDELGTYEIVNKYGDTSYRQEFVVLQAYSDLFTGDFTSTNYGTLVGNNTVKGQIVTLTNGNSVTYSKLIDLSEHSFNEMLEDKSQNTPLLELYAQPHSLNVADLQTLYITLTDKYDSSNYIIIRINYLSYLPNSMRIRTMASGQSWVGYDYDFWTGDISVDSAQGHDDGGTIVSFNCVQNADGRDFSERMLRLYFDNETGRLYTRTWQDKAGNSTADNYVAIPWLIRDYKTTDPTLSAGDTPWKGFTTGEVYLSIYATGINDTADLLITNINGEDMSGEYYVDDVAPTITVDVNEKDVPVAQVGKNFKVFDFVANDLYSRVVEQSVKVYYGREEITLNEGAFVPESVGKYSIVYSALDTFGNVATKTIEVEAENSLTKFRIDLEGTIENNASFGQLIELPNAITSGGAGGATIEITVKALDADTDVKISNGTFRALYAGTYYVLYTAKDYIGTTATKSVFINVSFSAEPVFDENSIVLPSAFISGNTYRFDDYFATYYNGNGGSEQIKAVITVADANGKNILTDGKYVPAASESIDKAVVTFSFSANGQTTTVVREIPILTVKNGLGHLANYFATNGTIEALNNALAFTPNGVEPMNIAFAKAISQRYLTIGMKCENVGAFTQMDILLRDISDPNATVKLTYKNRSGNLTFSINDGAEYKANFDADGNLQIKYDNASKRIYDVLGMEIGTITQYEDGSEFNGFPSGMVYLEIEADGAVAITSIANQNFNDYVRDAISPLLTISGSFSGTYVPGQTVVIPSATAYDVLSATGEITVVVKSSTGEIVASGVADKELIFKPQTYGTYSVVYSVTDSAGNKMTYSSSFVVIDDVKPTLTFDESIPETAKVGTTLKLPSYTVSDNGDISKIVVKNYVCGPDGIMVLISGNGSIKLDTKGTYYVYYLVVDENDNVVNYTFKITVS